MSRCCSWSTNIYWAATFRDCSPFHDSTALQKIPSLYCAFYDNCAIEWNTFSSDWKRVYHTFDDNFVSVPFPLSTLLWCSILGIPVQFVVDSRKVKSFWNIYKSTIWYPIYISTKTLSKWRFKFSLIPVIDRVPVNTKISLCTYSEYRMNNIFLGNFISGRTLKFKLAKIVSTNIVVNNKNLPPLLLVMMAGMK